MPSPDILLVDDDADIRDSLELALELEGYDVATARHGEEAWRLLVAGEVPRLVLLDLAMPVLDGAKLLARVRDDPRFQALPVVILTAFSALTAGVTAHAQGCLRKPIDLAAVLELAVRYCPRRQVG